ncbi:MAG: hypothetical protein LCH41_11360 [Armatimonadetes bacterium]|nr:hypothetical protein [Armatimonadota bacterium]
MSTSGEITRAEFDALLAEVTRLREQLAKLQPEEEAISEEVLLVIASAVAAFLGKRATIKFVRTASQGADDPWRAQGRVKVTGSHQMPRTRAW